MSLWQTLLIAALTLALAFAGLCALLAMLYHVRFEAAWMGMWTGAASLPHEKFLHLEHGFPGFMRPLAWSSIADDEDDGDEEDDEDAKDDGSGEGATADDVTRTGTTTTSLATQSASLPSPHPETPAATANPAEDVIATPSPAPSSEVLESSPETMPEAAGSGGGKEGSRVAEAHDGAKTFPSAANATAHKTRRRRAKVNQFRRALFRFVTDGPAWRLQSGYFLRGARSALRLANVRVEFSAGHPDPAKLGRFAGYWYALSPFLPTRNASMAFRFQDRHPSFGARVTAAFSLFAVARFGARLVLTFPYVRLSRRALQGWRERRLQGWRAFVYRKIQTL